MLHIVILSVIFQISAAILSLRLLRYGPGQKIGSLMFIIMGLMAARRSLSLVQIYNGHTTIYEMESEIIGLTSSGIMVVIIVWLHRVIKSAAFSNRELIRSKHRFRNVLEHAAESLFIFRRDGQLIDVNKWACHSLGFSRSYLLSMNIRDIAPSFATKRTEDLLRLISPNNPVTVETVLLRADKTSISVEIKLVDLEISGQSHILALARDITERLKAEEERNQLAAALRHTVDSVIITNADGIIQYVNPSFEKATGYTREELIGKTPAIMKSGAHDQAFYRDLWSTIKSGRSWNGNFINRRKDATLVNFTASISPVFDEIGVVRNFVGVERDVSREAALSRAKDFFTQITSHELRTPLFQLGIIKGLVNELDEKTPSAAKLNHIKTFMNSAYDQFDRIVSSTTLINELNSPNRKKSFAPVHIYLTLVSCWERLSAIVEFEKRNVRLELAIRELPRDIQIMGDHDMVTKVVEEGLSNAIKYTPNGKKVTLSATTRDGQAFVIIRDEGSGLPKETLDHIFDSYFADHSPDHHSTGKYKYLGGGMGLGLTISKMIMEYHSGSLTLENASDGEGAVFIAGFPIATG